MRISLEETYNSLMEEARKRKEIETIIGSEKVDEALELLQKNTKGRELYLSLLRLLGRDKGLMLYRHVKEETASMP